MNEECKVLTPTELSNLDIKDITVYVPARGTFLRACKGVGDIPYDEDLNGYEFKDYVYITESQYSDGELIEVDGGQMILGRYYEDVYENTDNETIHKLITDSMNLIWDVSYPYIVITDRVISKDEYVWYGDFQINLTKKEIPNTVHTFNMDHIEQFAKIYAIFNTMDFIKGERECANEADAWYSAIKLLSKTED